MLLFSLLFINHFITFLSAVQESNAGTNQIEDIKAAKPNSLCSRIEKYDEEIERTYVVYYEVPYRGLCWKIIPICTKHRKEAKLVKSKVRIWKTKTVIDCCPEYERINETCIASCPKGCVHGVCEEPSKCACDEGWEGVSCAHECKAGWYGRGCEFYCSCHNGATCNKYNGTCYCEPGYTGRFCESACPEQLHGRRCENTCKCQNGGMCDLTFKTCSCPDGYKGDSCEALCVAGTFGKGCNDICTCKADTTEFCSPTDGRCVCKPGWKGDKCEKPCPSSQWGPFCNNTCVCGSNGVCDHVSGECSCKPGFHGLKCDEKCPNGFFEKDCKMKCPDCIHHSGTCHHVSGWCNCPAGSTGKFCDLECPTGKFGENCSRDCICINSSTCNAVTGNCTCLPGWIGQYCTIPCPDGMYGLNCGFDCNCTGNTSCDASNGSCLCDVNATESLCLQYNFNGFFEHSYFDGNEDPSLVLIILLGVSLIAGILLIVCFLICIRRKFKNTNSNIYREETSTTNIVQEDPSPHFSARRFMNPNYESSYTPEKRLTAVVAPASSRRDKFSEEMKKQNITKNSLESLSEEEFAIPESNDGSSDLMSKVEIFFENDSRNSILMDPMKQHSDFPCVKYSKSDDAFPFSNTNSNVTERKESALYADVEFKEEHHYENPEDLLETIDNRKAYDVLE